jgi:hypothetical protein
VTITDPVELAGHMICDAGLEDATEPAQLMLRVIDAIDDCDHEAVEEYRAGRELDARIYGEALQAFDAWSQGLMARCSPEG